MLTFGSLFAGIGGFDLGFERAGMKCLWQVEIDDYANKVLAKHWPDVKRHRDVRTFARFAGDMEACDCCGEPFCNICDAHFAECGCVGISELSDEWGQPDIICGGFPCQDISLAGQGAGLNGERSGLWQEFFRIICAIRPRIVVIENSPALVIRGLDRILCDLASVGFDAEWQPVRASDFALPHRRERCFIVAYANSIDGGEGMGVVSHRTREVFNSDLRERLSVWVQAPDCFAGMDDGVSGRTYRHRGRCIGNSVAAPVAEWVGRRIIEVFDNN